MLPLGPAATSLLPSAEDATACQFVTGAKVCVQVWAGARRGTSKAGNSSRWSCRDFIRSQEAGEIRGYLRWDFKSKRGLTTKRLTQRRRGAETQRETKGTPSRWDSRKWNQRVCQRPRGFVTRKSLANPCDEDKATKIVNNSSLTTLTTDQMGNPGSSLLMDNNQTNKGTLKCKP